MTENDNITGVANFLREVSRVEDKLRLKEGVLFACLQDLEID